MHYLHTNCRYVRKYPAAECCRCSASLPVPPHLFSSFAKRRNRNPSRAGKYLTWHWRLIKPAIYCGGAGKPRQRGMNFGLIPARMLDIVAWPAHCHPQRSGTQKHTIREENSALHREDVFKKPKFADAVIISNARQPALRSLHEGP